MQKKKFNNELDDPLGLLGGGPSATTKKPTKQNAFEKAMREQEKQLLGNHPRPETEAWVQNPNFKVPGKDDAPVMKNPFGIPSATVTKETPTEKPASKGDISLFGNNNNGSPTPIRNPFERAEKPETNSEGSNPFRNPFGPKEDTTSAGGEKPAMKNPFAAKDDKPHFMQAGENTGNAAPRNPFQQVAAAATEKSDEEENSRGSRPRGAHVKIEDLRLSTDELLPGEKIANSLKCTITPAQYPHLSAEGILGVTNFKIVFKPNDETYMKKGFFKSTYFQLPHGFISRIERKTDKNNFEIVYLDIYSKDGRLFKFRIVEKFSSESNAFIQLLFVFAFPDRKTDLFAFEYGKAGKSLEDNYGGWKIYDIEREFHRQGIDFAEINDRSTNHLYRLIDNSNGQVCSTYPPKLLIPARVSDQAIASCSRFRTKERIPAITYYYKKTKTVLARSSQSKPGITQARCLEDELLLRLLGNPLETNESEISQENLYIYDARPYLNAVANRVNGKGFEDPKWYRNSKIFFMDIDNIHHVRDGHKKLMGMCNSHEVANNKWYSQLHDSNWLAFMSYIIGASCKVARSLRDKKNVLVHCSDGWDRTSQILSLAQMMLDPYFRTIEGFEVLVMKDWVYFGHQFNLRTGHGNKNEKDEQRSPVFLQFLDCIHQLIHQYPFAFEFNDKFLFDIAHHIYSCQFGTFLCNSYQEMKQYKMEEKTINIWSFLNSQKERYLNTYYKPADPENPIILNPSYHMKQLRLWEEFFLYFSWLSKPNYHHLSDNVVFHKDFYEVMYLKEKSKTKDMKKEIEELKAKLQKYEAIEEKPTNDSQEDKEDIKQDEEEPIFDYIGQEESQKELNESPAVITGDDKDEEESPAVMTGGDKDEEESPLKATEDGEKAVEEEEISAEAKAERDLE